MSTTAASHLSPAFPLRAPWGTADALRAWQQEALTPTSPRRSRRPRLPRGGDPRRRQDDLRPARGHRAARARTSSRPSPSSRRPSTSSTSGPTRRAGSASPWTRGSATRQGAVGGDYTGVAVTYAQVAAHPLLHRRRTEVRRTLVILDEVHHGGDALSWGDAVREAFDPATRRLALTGTPFRSDTSAIPFVTYARGTRRRTPVGGRLLLRLRPGAGRRRRPAGDLPVLLRRRCAGGPGPATRSRPTLGEPLTKDLTAHAWRTALDPQGNWIPQVLAAADQRLTEVRRGVPDAGGLVIATDQDSARAYAAQLRRITGEAPTVVLSDEPGSSRPDRRVLGRRGPLDGRRPDGLRRRRRAPPRGRGLRDLDRDAAVLRPGRRPVRAGPAAR